MNKEVIEEIDEAVRIAESDSLPDPEDCLTDVYFEE